jgi:hypothetical protein
MAYLQGYLYFICNDCDYTQNVEKLNRRIDKHNADIGEREKRKLEIQEKIANGQLFLPDPEPPTPVQPAKPAAEVQDEPTEEKKDAGEAPAPDNVDDLIAQGEKQVENN